MTPAEIAELLGQYQFNFADEKELQEGIATVLTSAGVSFTREFVLDQRSTIDFLIGKSVGLEVKIKCPINQLITQLHRYAQYDQLSHLILVTTRMRHQNMPATLNNKPLEVVHLIGSIF